MDGFQFSDLLFGLPVWAMILGIFLGLFGVVLFASIPRLQADKALPRDSGSPPRS